MRSLFSLLVAVLALSACRTAGSTPPSPAVEPPPVSLEELGTRRLQSLMGKLATHLLDVNAQLGRTTFTEQNRLEVARLLSEVDDLAVAIADEPEAKNHPNFDAFFPAFAMRARQARNEARAEPPSYRTVSELTEVCIACHAVTRP